jgi:hypothetical protein
MEKAFAVVSGVCMVLAFLLGLLLRGRSGEKAAVMDADKYEEVKREIEKTPAGDLVDADPNADELRADAGAIAGKFRERLRDRAGKVLSGKGGSGSDGGGRGRDRGGC